MMTVVGSEHCHETGTEREYRSEKILCCRVITMTKILAVFEATTIVLLIGYYVFGVYQPMQQTTKGYQQGFASSASRTWYCGVAILVALFLVILIIGLYKQSVRMIYGYEFVLVLQICVCIFIIVDVITAGKNSTLLTALGVSCCIIFIVVKTFFCYVIYRCGKYLSERGSSTISPANCHSVTYTSNNGANCTNVAITTSDQHQQVVYPNVRKQSKLLLPPLNQKKSAIVVS